MARQRIRKKPMSQINVVPYIDVSLVLLIIFMITTPLLTQGVKVELPQAAAKPLSVEQHPPLVVKVDAKGGYYLQIGTGSEQSVDLDTLMARVAAVLRQRPGTPVVVKGDEAVPYGDMINVMAALKNAGVPTVSLATKPLERRR